MVFVRKRFFLDDSSEVFHIEQIFDNFQNYKHEKKFFSKKIKFFLLSHKKILYLRCLTDHSLQKIVFMKANLFFLFIFCANVIFAQRTVTGIITDKSGKSVSDAKISVKNTQVQTYTNVDGKYSIEIPEGNKTLEFSKKGFRVREVEVSGDVVNIMLTLISDVRDIFELSLEELMQVEVVTASNVKEKISDAPATTIVITKEQIQERNYKDLLEILQELPGIDMSIAWGDTYFKDYWRGYRNTIGSPYLFMIDGIIYNDPYFNRTTLMVATPLSNISQIEVVYGPASSVYGANAFMGVINIITKKQCEAEMNVTTNMASTTKGFTWLDMNIIHKTEKTTLSLTVRYEDGDLNQMINNDDFYWLQNKFLTDKKLWGDFVNNSKLGGTFSSPIKNTGIDLRFYRGGLELAAQYYENYTGCGSIYPADKTTPQSLWILPDYNFYARYRHDFSEKFHSSTMIRYRMSNLSSESQDLEGYNITNKGETDMTIGGGVIVKPGESARIVQLTYWQSLNSVRSIFQDFEWNVNNSLSFNAGLKYEDKNLQKAYDLNGGTLYFPDSLKKISNALPNSLPATLQSYNRINWIDRGIYLHGKYKLGENSVFNLGCRIDENSAYGTSPTFRAGFVQKIGKIYLKLLYGQAFQEPVPRNLYGAWVGSGADPNLKPEKSQTFEVNISYTKSSINNLLSFWWANNTNTIVNTTDGAKNLGERNVVGLDYLLQIEVPLFKKTNLQMYYSLILKEEEAKFGADNVKTGMGIIGDLSHHKIHFGITSYISKKLLINLKGQYRSEADAVSTNPLKTIPAYFVLDGNIIWKNFAVKGMGISLKVTNIFNTQYFHPGLRNADSGDSGGEWQGNAWQGSKGWYNSLLPQPRRMIILGMAFNF